MPSPRAALLAVLAVATVAGSAAAIHSTDRPSAPAPSSTAGPHRVALALPATPPAAPVLPADPCALGVDQLEAVGLTEAEALDRRTPCHPLTVTTTTAPAHPSSAPRSSSTSSRPSSPAATSSAPAAAPPAVLAQPRPNGTELQGPSMCTDPIDCPTGDQLDAERIGRVIDTPDGRRCTVVAVNPDRLECTPEP